MEPSAPSESALAASDPIRILRTKEECDECIELGNQSNRLVILHIIYQGHYGEALASYKNILKESAKEYPSVICCEVDLRSDMSDMDCPPVKQSMLAPELIRRINELNLKQLRRILRSLGMNNKGSEDELRARLILPYPTPLSIEEAIEADRASRLKMDADTERIKVLWTHLKVEEFPNNIIIYYNGSQQKVKKDEAMYWTKEYMKRTITSYVPSPAPSPPPSPAPSPAPASVIYAEHVQTSSQEDKDRTEELEKQVQILIQENKRLKNISHQHLLRSPSPRSSAGEEEAVGGDAGLFPEHWGEPPLMRVGPGALAAWITHKMAEDAGARKSATLKEKIAARKRAEKDAAEREAAEREQEAARFRADRGGGRYDDRRDDRHDDRGRAEGGGARYDDRRADLGRADRGRSDRGGGRYDERRGDRCDERRR